MDDDLRDLPLAGQLRAQLCAFIDDAGTKRLLPTRFHVGTPGGAHVTVRHDPSHGAGLRADLVTRAIDGLDGAAGERPCPWITRSGDLHRGDADLQWFAASREAFARHGLVLPGFFVITRRGWVNVPTEEEQVWARFRNRRRAAS